jgi:hypothetical protein
MLLSQNQQNLPPTQSKMQVLIALNSPSNTPIAIDGV